MGYDHARQLKTIEGTEQSINEQIFKPGYKLLLNKVSVPYVYSMTSLDEYIDRIDLDSTVISGEIAGACLLESLVPPKGPIRSSRDFIDTRAGVCLLVDVSQSEIKDHFDKPLLIVPTGCAVDMDLRVA